ncbi:MAG: hypothetical protein K0Q72_1675 [Armatimonadetes bacterium]|nr:hypothetical protein [Armatimonadota bacterium]
MARIPCLIALAAALLVTGAGRAGGDASPGPQKIAGLSITARLAGEQRQYAVGQRVPLELVVRNTTVQPVRFRYLGGWWWAGPSIEVTRDGKRQPVRETELLGTVPIMSKEVKPGATVELPYVGLWLGQGGKGHESEPTLVDPAPGKYQATLVSPYYQDGGRQSARIGGNVEFEIIAR